MTHNTYNKRPNAQTETVLTEAAHKLCEKYGLTDPTQQSVLLTMLHQLRHNNTIGYSLEDLVDRFDMLLGAARAHAKGRTR
jgi:hypothetical protein